jgi:hypothetical protein
MMRDPGLFVSTLQGTTYDFHPWVPLPYWGSLQTHIDALPKLSFVVFNPSLYVGHRCFVRSLPESVGQFEKDLDGVQDLPIDHFLCFRSRFA